MDASVMVDVQIPAVSLRYDMEFPLDAAVETIIQACIAWAGQSGSCSLALDAVHFLFNVRTGERLLGHDQLRHSQVEAGDHLILF